jgi:glucose dehydrogenase
MRVLASLAVVVALSAITTAQPNWVHYGQDPGGTKYSSLAQINTGNVATLTRAWVVHTGDTGGFFSSSPLAIDNVVYFTSASGVWAVQGDTGKQLWKYPARNPARRGVSYWQGDPQHRSRILVTVGSTLVALDPKTGTPLPEFGTNGIVQMGSGWGSPPAIYKNFVITGGGEPTVRAWDARSGALVWTRSLIAQPGDPGHETWENDAWKRPGGNNVWAFLSVDPDNGLVFAPVSQAGYDYAGLERPGNNLYADSVVAIDANTGTLRWYQQTVHHDIWDYDLPAQPTLIDITRNGRKIPVVVQYSKTGMLYIYNRLTGEPVFPIDEKPVPKSTIEGEKTAPTQPFTIKSLQLARNSITRDELYSLTPAHADFCKSLWDKNNAFNDGPYTPWTMKESGRTAVIFPGAVGGGNWGGVASDPTTGYVFANVMNTGQWGYLEKGGGGRGGAGGSGLTKSTPFGEGNPARFRFWNPETQWPCQNPPWGEFIAINANTGSIAWRVPLGSFPDAEKQGVKNAGTPNMGGAIATAGGVVFIGATLDAKFRAFDAKTGKVLWETSVDAPAHSIPSTYIGGDGRQYVVLPAGGGGFLQGPTGDSFIAFALPK